MFRNYLSIAWRNIQKNKIFSAINILGLIIGMTGCLLISLYILQELSYDKFQEKGDRIARVIMDYSFGANVAGKRGNFTSIRVAPVFKATFPEVEDAVRMQRYERVVRYEDKMITEKNFLYADASFFNLFYAKIRSDNAGNALSAPYDLVLTASAAKRYFGDDNPLGKALKVGNDSNLYRVTAVMDDYPSNSQLQFDMIASFSSLGLPAEFENTYFEANYVTYLLLKDPSGIKSLQSRLPAFMKKEMEGKSASVDFFLEPFHEIYLRSPFGGFVPNNSITYLYILGAVALLILIIACSTYINLSTARSLERAREVGVRKVVGAEKLQLFRQFLTESALVCLIALGISIALSYFILPLFNELAGTAIAGKSLFSIQFLSFAISLSLFISVLAGFYPAWILTGFQPVRVLKGSFKNSASGLLLRKSLIVFQFAISVFLIIATFVVKQQLHLIQHKQLGYDRDHILIINMDDQMTANIQTIKRELKTNPGVISVARCNRSPAEGGGGYNMRNSSIPGDEEIAINANPVDEDFVTTVGMEIVAGSNFTSQDIKDAGKEKMDDRLYHFILSESAAKQLNWTPEEAIGKEMRMGPRNGLVRGVIKDFHFESLHKPLQPFVLFTEDRGRQLLVKMSGKNIPQTIAFLVSKWKTLVPHRPFAYRFMDDVYNQLYSTELRLGKIMNVFAAVAILLACMGLFGLSAYTVKQRFKEIGIRKVLGASTENIVLGLSKGFIGLTAIAILVTFPVAWWASSKWLQNFSYRINISWGLFIIAGLATLLITFITISFQTIRAARANPVKSLRVE